MPRKTPPSMLTALRAVIRRLRDTPPGCPAPVIAAGNRAPAGRRTAALARSRDAPPGYA